MAWAYFCSLLQTYSAIAFQEPVAMKTFRCKACHRIHPVNPRNPSQQYCGHADCQRARKREWQRNKRNSDPDYRQNQIDAHKRWLKRNPDYWREYRKRKKSSSPPPGLTDAKMDGSLQNLSIVAGVYIISPIDSQNIKMDAFKAIILPITGSYNQTKDDIIGNFAAFAYDHRKNNGQVRTPPSCSPWQQLFTSALIPLMRPSLGIRIEWNRTLK